MKQDTSAEAGLTPDDALKRLEEVRDGMRATFGAHHSDRLAQLEAALNTAAMVVEHLVSEEEREVDLATRIVGREVVHNGHEVLSPVGRAYPETLRIAGKGKG